MDELKEKLLNICNESGLPLECIVYVIKDLWRDAEESLIRYKSELQNKGEEEKGNGN